jgi:hypothetical protein
VTTVFFFLLGEGTNTIIAMKDLLLFEKRFDVELYLTGYLPYLQPILRWGRSTYSVSNEHT